MKLISINKGARLAIASHAPCILYDICKNDDKDKALKEAYENRNKLITLCTKNILAGKNPTSNRIYKTLLTLSNPEIMTMDDYTNCQIQYLKYNTELREITEQEFIEVLNLLLPYNVYYINNCFLIMITEIISLSFARQYAEKNGRFFTKLVVLNDRSTWIYNDL